MKISVNELLPSWVTDPYDFLMWLDADIGISTSGLRLFLGLVDWIISRLSGDVCESTGQPYCRPFALYWGSHNALKSHEARPWKPEWKYDDFPF
jgi:hypothetical protein